MELHLILEIEYQFLPETNCKEEVRVQNLLYALTGMEFPLTWDDLTDDEQRVLRCHGYDLA